MKPRRIGRLSSALLRGNGHYGRGCFGRPFKVALQTSHGALVSYGSYGTHSG